MPEDKDKEEEVAALALLACKHKRRRADNADILKRTGMILDRFIFLNSVDSVSVDLNACTEYSRSLDRGKAGAREKIRNVLEAAGVEITKTKRGKYVATMRIES